MWRLLAPMFVLLALDELLGFHEQLIGPVRRGLHTSGPFDFAWVLPSGAACLAGAAACLTTCWRLDPATLWTPPSA